jgi:hypothetical protein
MHESRPGRLAARGRRPENASPDGFFRGFFYAVPFAALLWILLILVAFVFYWNLVR